MQKFEELSLEQMENGTPDDKLIIIKAIFSKDAKLKLQPSKDALNGRYKGIEENVSEVEKMKRGYLPSPSSAITIKDGYTFDLNDPQDLADWEWVKHSRHIAEDFDAAQQTGLSEAWFYIFRPGAESRKKLREIEEEFNLVSKIMNDSQTNIYNRVRLLGLDMTGSPISDVKEYLLSAAKDKRRRHEVSEIYDNADISLKLMLYHGLDKGVIKNDGFSYRYNNVLLGTTEDLVIEYMKSHKNISILKEMESAIYPEKGEGRDAPVQDGPLSGDDAAEDTLTPLEKARAAKAAKNKNK
jgi:hypothetical protein